MKLIKLPNLLLLILVLVASGNIASAQCPSITQQPPSTISVCEGVTAKVVVVASGTGNTYQWQEFDGSVWTNISALPYTGFTTDTLTINGSPSVIDGYRFRCIVSKTGCSSQTSNPATLTLMYPSFVITSPIDTTMCVGSIGTFEVEADGDGTTYKWQRLIGSTWTDLTNTAPFSGVTTSKLSITNPPLGLSGSYYRVEIGGTCPPGALSDSAMLTVNDRPKISSHPTDKSVCAETQVIFACAASGTNIQFQWQEDQGSGFVNLPGALPYAGTYTNQLTILYTGVTAAKNGWKYRCVITGTCNPADTTLAATLTVRTSPQFTSITQLDSICEGDDTEIEVIAAGSDITYQWFENKNDGNGYHEVNDNNIFSGSKLSKLKISKVPFSFAGNLYYCDLIGSCAPKAPSSTVTLKLKQDKNVLVDPRDTAVIINKEATFTVQVDGSNLFYHWQVDDGKGFQSIDPGSPHYSGVNSKTLLVKNPKMSISGYKYRCLVYGGCDEAPSASKGATLNVWWPASVNDVTAGGDAIIYPNPVQGSQLSIEVSNSSLRNVDIKVADQFGRTLISENHILNNSKTTVNISQLPVGVYSIFITSAEFNMVKTIKFSKL